MSEWREYRIGDLMTLEYGKSLKDYRNEEGEYDVFGTNGKIGTTSDFLYDKPSLIIGRKGAYREVRYSEDPFYVIDTAFYTVSQFDDMDILFMYYWFKNVDINRMNSGSAIPSTSRDEVYDLEIFLPPLPEQKAIASVLSSLDDKIDLLHRQNQTLEAMAETLFRQWFQPSQALRSAGAEEAEEDWEEGVIPDEFDFTMGLSPPGKSYNEEGIGTPMFQGSTDFAFRFPTNRVYTTEPKRFAQKYDTLVSVRAPVGDQNMAKEKCCIGRGVAAFRYKRNNSFYTYTYFKIKSLMDKIKVFNQSGTVFGSITKGNFENMEIEIPPFSLIQHFQESIKPLDDRIIKNCHQIQILEKLRDTLLPKLMSRDQVRVNMD